MLAHDPAINRTRRHARLSRQRASQPRRVEERATPNDLRRRQTRVLQREISQNIDRVRNQQQNCFLVERLHIVDDAAQDRLVATDQVRARFAFLLRCAGGHDDDVALSRFGVLCGAHAGAGVAVVGCVAEVLDLGIADFGFGVDEEDFGGDLVVLSRGRKC